MHDDGFRHETSGNMRGLSRPAARFGARMRDLVVTDLLTVKVIPEPRCDRHSQLPLGAERYVGW
jgi:hypothetical protein